MARTVTFPLPVVILGTVTLIVSLIAHVVSLAFYLDLTSSSADTSQDASEKAFPIPIRPATLKTVKSGRFGLFANDSDWDILPPGDGFLVHPEDGQHYLVAHYHQLHCLRSFRHYLNLAMSGGPGNFSSIDAGHVNHCMIYLRQLAMCNTDLTLEPASHKQMTVKGKVAATVTGVGVTHQCKDWSQVWEYMETNFEENKDSYDR